MALITGKNIQLGYDGITLVDNLDFEINPGDYVCVVGENGSGKTTFTKTIVGLKNILGGELIFEENFKKSDIGYLPQRTEIQKDFPATVEEIVLSGCQSAMGFRPFYGKLEKSLAYENMEKLEIADIAKCSFKELSGGQQQRVLLARALCATKKLLVLDEPVTGLDPKATDQMYKIIKRLNHKGITVIMVSHDMNSTYEYASHILHIGKKTYFCTTDDYIRSNRVMFYKKRGRVHE